MLCFGCKHFQVAAGVLEVEKISPLISLSLGLTKNFWVLTLQIKDTEVVGVEMGSKSDV